jgi:hypothetical protein
MLRPLNITGAIKTADFVEAKEVESNVKFDTENQVAWTHSADGTQHDFVIKKLRRPIKCRK